MTRRHLVIPDTQVKPGVPTDHLRWIGQYMVDKRFEVVVHLGDHWDMASLSSYDRGKRAAEGRRYALDVDAGNDAMVELMAPLWRFNDRKSVKANPEKAYSPELHLLRGNHENRIVRAADDQGFLDGTVTLDDLISPGWAVHDFLDVVDIDGIRYSHYFANPMSGRPYGGQAATRLKTIGCSFTMGHQQVFDYATRSVAGGTQMHHGLICGACYLHDEGYLGPQGNLQWRGVIVCNEVENGNYDIMTVSLNYLCRRYEGVSLAEFLGERYPDGWQEY